MQAKKMLMSARRSARRSTAPECVRAFVRDVFPKGGEEKREAIMNRERDMHKDVETN